MVQDASSCPFEAYFKVLTWPISATPWKAKNQRLLPWCSLGQCEHMSRIKAEIYCHSLRPGTERLSWHMAACACWQFGASVSVIQSLDSCGLWTAVAGGYLVCICAHHIDMFYSWICWACVVFIFNKKDQDQQNMKHIPWDQWNCSIIGLVLRPLDSVSRLLVPSPGTYM